MLIAYLCIQKSSSMTDSMNFGPEWLRNLSEGSTGSASGGGTRYQLADYRYGREEMLALYEKNLRPPTSLSGFPSLYSEQVLPPLALIPQTDEDRGWQPRPVPPAGVIRGGRGGSLERGGRISRGRGPYQQYGRGGYDGSGGWNSTEQTEWSPRKDYNTRASSVDNWRRNRGSEDDDGWRNNNTRGSEKWGRSTSWRDGGEGGDERGPPERSNRSSWQENTRGSLQRRPWENDDHLPEWAMENPSETGGSFDATGAFHGSDDEQRDQKHVNKREIPLQKSVSQQNIVTKTHPSTLPTSQSAISLSKPPDDFTIEEKLQDKVDEDQEIQIHHTAKLEKRIVKDFDVEQHTKQINKIEQTLHHKLEKNIENVSHMNNTEAINGITAPDLNNRVEEEFDRLQEDLVQKLVVEEETPKKINMESYNISSTSNNIVPPPNLSQPLQDKWYYQDPQGDLQGPFLSSEMAEWFRAGYFTSTLLVKRLCDESFYRLGDLVAMCSGNPFQCNMRIPTLKLEVPPPTADNDLLQYQLLQRQFAYRQAQASNIRSLSQPEPWANLSSLQQRDLLNQQVLVQAQMAPEIPLYQQSQQPATNPLMHMINQMQQGNKLSGPTMPEKQPSVQQQLDPIQALVQQMGGLQSLTNNRQVGPSSGLPTTIPSSVGLSGTLQTSGLSTNLSNSGLLNNYQNLSAGSLPVPVGLSVSGGMPGSGSLLVSGANLHNNTIPVSSGVLTSNTGISGSDVLSNSSGLPVSLQGGLPGGLTENTLPPRPNPLGAVDPLVSTNENDPIKNLLRQLANKQQTPQLDTLWQQNQFTNAQPKPQWQKTESPLTMWDIPTSTVPISMPNTTASVEKQSATSSEQLQKQEKERQKQLKENLEREQKKKREEEKQAKKEAEKKAAEEKRKKEEEKIKKEMEKLKKEAEEKRLRELEEKRRLKEQRKAEEEARKKFEEQKRLEEAEKAKQEMKEKEEQLRRQAEHNRLENNVKVSRNAPWSQANSTPELSLADIQKAEREKRAEQAALLQMQLIEKQTLQFSWAKKAPDSGKVKTFAEIQQEEQDRVAKQAAEARLAYQKDKETHSVMAPTVVMPWNSSNLSWASTAAQWSSFWEEAPVQKSPNKPSTVSKSNSTSAVNVNKPVAKQTKGKTKKEEQHVIKLFSNGPATDEFTDWCTTALKKLNSTVDIPTFISFLRDIESALEVRDYCKEYLGEGPTTQQFASQFLEKRRMIKPKVTTQKDDMSSPAPAITPSSLHNPDFQEVKGKGKKIKKSKMTKVDSRILGFSVTAAPDRINVGDRDYVEN
ncbi:hypothetical protein RI129_007882 [Pyrocoelia pectoralis]|uniref:GYF domain-containing protein n=1 Tax=Pyrocoelia pectoralis TaxID=417401 RepID=A0AAN7VAH4_9COLE